MPNRRSHCPAAIWAAVLLATACLTSSGEAAAQSAVTFSPTYAASEGSPYRDIYARAFGAGGAPAEEVPPLVTGSGPGAPAPPATERGGQAIANEIAANDVVYVIEDGRLLTYRGEDYASGGPPLAGAAVPPAAGGGTASPRPDLSSIADRLYSAPPLATAAGPAASSRPGGPIQLVPPAN